MKTQQVIEAKRVEKQCAFCANDSSRCPYYTPAIQSKFSEVSLDARAFYASDELQSYLVIFVQQGECILHCKNTQEISLPDRTMIMLPQGDTFRLTAVRRSTVVLAQFDEMPDFCENVRLQSFLRYCKQPYHYRPTGMDPNISTLVSECLFLIQHGLRCRKMFKLKESEFFYLLTVLYTPQEVACFLYPILGDSMDFRAIVKRHYSLSLNAVDLIQKTGLSSAVFYKRFRQEFGMPVKEWIVKHKVGQMKVIAMENGMTAKQLMHRCGFSTAGHFAQFCKRHTQMTPTELINSLHGKKDKEK